MGIAPRQEGGLSGNLRAPVDPSEARQVDSHMDFDKKWDETLMGQWAETQNDRARSTVSKSTAFHAVLAAHLALVHNVFPRATEGANSLERPQRSLGTQCTPSTPGVLPRCSQVLPRYYRVLTGYSQPPVAIRIERIRPTRARRRRY